MWMWLGCLVYLVELPLAKIKNKYKHKAFKIKSLLNRHEYWVYPEVGNWPKKSSALALEIVSLKCNALVIMH